MAKAATRVRRVTKKNPDPNPLFTKWLQEWKDAAVAHNSKAQHVYGKATWSGASCHDWMSKSDLIMAAQPLCDASFTQPLADSHYTAWSSVASLIRRGLVSKQGCPARFSLTDEGEELANCIMAPGTPCGSAASSSDECQPLPRFSDSDDTVVSLAPMQPPLLPLDTLRIVLLVDCSETMASCRPTIASLARTVSMATCSSCTLALPCPLGPSTNRVMSSAYTEMCTQWPPLLGRQPGRASITRLKSKGLTTEPCSVPTSTGQVQ